MVMKLEPVGQEVGVNPGLSVFQTLLKSYQPPDCDIRFWDGSTWQAEARPRFTIALNHPGALEMMFSVPLELSLGETYAGGDYEIEGDFEASDSPIT